MKAIVLAIALFSAGFAHANGVPGKPAPAFEVQDANGKTQKLSDYKGQWVVLEWFNKDCPYVKKHYGAKNMQKIQKTYTDKKVVWLTIISSAVGEQGYTDAKTTLTDFKERDSMPTAVLLDPKGVVGKAYGAKTTPHMFVINPNQDIVYAGAIDDNDSADPSVIAKSKNYVAAALDAGLANKPIPTASTRPYGCAVKYQ